MQRHRHNNIDGIEEIRILELHRCLSSELVGYHRLVRVFHLMYQSLYGVVFLKEQECGSPVQMLHIRQCCFRHVFAEYSLFGSWQGCQARIA